MNKLLVTILICTFNYCITICQNRYMVNDYDESFYKSNAGDDYFLQYFITNNDSKTHFKVRKYLTSGKHKLIVSKNHNLAENLGIELVSENEINLLRVNEYVYEFYNPANQYVQFSIGNCTPLAKKDIVLGVFHGYEPFFKKTIPNFKFKTFDDGFIDNTQLKQDELYLFFFWDSNLDFNKENVGILNKIQSEYNINVISISGHPLEHMKELGKIKNAEFMLCHSEFNLRSNFKQGSLIPMLQYIITDSKNTLFWHIGDHYKLKESLSTAINRLDK